MTLYIDTHFEKLVLALFKEDNLVEKKELESNLHSKNTIPLLQELLNKNNVEIEDLKDIIVITGPGSFTGVRIGVVIAKILGYTKNINIKPISFLEAISLKYEDEVTLGIKDRNGAFIATFKNHEMLKDNEYLSNQELEGKDNIIYDDEVDLNELIKYSKNIESINPHLLKPLYIKKIEAQK